MSHKIWIVGIGPGREDMMTQQALYVLDQADLIVGYTVYVELLGERYAHKEKRTTPMMQEKERCELCFQEASAGRKVALICSGDAGIYGLASLMYETGKAYRDVAIEVIPGITAANSGAALLGAPLNHDFCTISLSDRLTPWERISRRLTAAAFGDFVIVLYNPASRSRKDSLRRACDTLLRVMDEERCCGYVENIGREGTSVRVCTLRELRDTDVNMFTTVYIGNSESRFLDGRLITKRGYRGEENTDLCRNDRGQETL